MSAFNDLLGEKLQGKGGSTIQVSDALSGKVVGLYFSAHWCGPCRQFTPELSDIYAKLTEEAGKAFEIVFISSDSSEEEFGEYFATMPWLALPFEDRDRKGALSKKFKVNGIPTLVILNAEAEVITANGRSSVSRIDDFPWTARSFDDLLGDTLVAPSGGSVDSSALSPQVLGLYFSAHWCPPCRGFTPKLIERYKKLKEAGKDFEIVFVSSDKDATSFDEYFADMPWLALPFEKRDEKSLLSEMFDVGGIPTLCFVDRATGKTITDEGRSAIMSPSFVEDFPFHPKPCNDLAETTGGIQDHASLVVLVEGVEADAKEAVCEAVSVLAARTFEMPEGDRPVGRFFTGRGGGPTARIREMVGFCALVTKHEHALENDSSGGGWQCDGCGGGGGDDERFRCTQGCDFDFCAACNAKTNEPLSPEQATPRAVILDLDDKGAYYVLDGDVSLESLTAFIEGYKAKTIERKQMS